MPSMNVVSSASPASSPSPSSPAGTGRRLAVGLRLMAGPLALAGFFLPWASGPGVLAGTEFTGFTLVGFAGRLQALELSPAAGGALLAIRLSLLGVAVAAVWQLLLAPAHWRHAGYAVSGWYLAAAAFALAVIGFARSGLAVPPVGLALVCAAAAAFVLGWLAGRTSGDKEHAAEG